MADEQWSIWLLDAERHGEATAHGKGSSSRDEVRKENAVAILRDLEILLFVVSNCKCCLGDGARRKVRE